MTRYGEGFCKSSLWRFQSLTLGVKRSRGVVASTQRSKIERWLTIQLSQSKMPSEEFKQRKAEYNKEYIAKHSEEHKARCRAYYEANKEKWAEYKKAERERKKAAKAAAAAPAPAPAPAAPAPSWDPETAMALVRALNLPLPKEAQMALLKNLKAELAGLS